MSLSSRKDKWAKYKYLYGSSALRPYLPDTDLFSESTFWSFIKQYGAIIVKPRSGSRGRNVYQVKRKGHNLFEVRLENKRIYLKGGEIYGYLRSRVGSDGSYIIQERISRAKIGFRPFDLRVIVQRWSRSSRWIVTARIAKLAGKGYIVSNITRSHGRLLRVSKAIRRSTIIGQRSTERIKNEINTVAVICAERLGGFFPDHRIFGLDMGLDRNGRVWIIEANLYPAMSHFVKLRDQSPYRRIMAMKQDRQLSGYF